MDELKKKMEEFIASSGQKIEAMQKRLDELGKDHPDFKSFEANLKEDLKKDLVQYDDLRTKIESIEQNEKNLEALISAGFGSKKNEINGEIKSDPEITNAFYTALKSGAMIAQSTELRERSADELIKAFMPHLNEHQRGFAKTMLVGSNPDGGFLVPASISSKIYQRLFETSPMRQICNVVKIVTDRFVFPIDDGEIECIWVGETDTRTETATAQVGEGEIPMMEIMAKPKIGLRLIEDATLDIDMWMTNKATTAFNRKANNAFILGNGNKKPRGFLDYDTATAEYTKGKLQAIDTAGSAIAGDDILSLYGKLFDEYVNPNTRFVMSKEIFMDICKLKDSNTGAYLINPKLLFEGFKPQLIGVQVAFMQDMPKTQVANAKTLAIGDFKEGYTVVDRIGMSITNDIVTEPGFLKKNFRARLGGGVTNYQAIKILKIKP